MRLVLLKEKSVGGLEHSRDERPLCRVRIQRLETILRTEAHPNAKRFERGRWKLQGCQEDIQHVQTSRQYRRLARRAV